MGRIITPADIRAMRPGYDDDDLRRMNIMRASAAALASASAPAAPYAHQIVTFNNDYLLCSGDAGIPISSVNQASFALGFFVPSTATFPPSPSNLTIMRAYTVATTYNIRLILNTAGKLVFGTNFSVGNPTLTSASAITTDTWYVIVCRAYYAVPNWIMDMWINGVQEMTTTFASGVSFAFGSAPDAVTIGASWNGSAASGIIDAKMKFAWGNITTNAADRISDAQVANFGTGSSDVNLGTGGATPTGTQPLFFFGGSHGYSDWNAGTNYGSDTDAWTMSGTVA